MSSMRRKSNRWISTAGLLCAMAAMPGMAVARPRPAAQTAALTNPGHVVGSVSAISGSTLSVKTDAGVLYSVTIPDSVKLMRVAPGDKDLSKAQSITTSDVGVGDRVLVRLAPGGASPFTAVSVIDIPHAAIVAKQREEQMEWQTHGVGGLVKSVDPASGTIVLASSTGAATKDVTLKVESTTMLRRYASDSVDYARATVAPITEIHVGDQLRALLDENASGAVKTAKEVVSGSFRNIAGKISSVNEKSGTITLRDLLTKKNVTIHILPTTQMKKLSDEQAARIAMLAKAVGAPGGAQGAAGGPGAWQHAAGQRPTNMPGGGPAGATSAPPSGAAHGWMNGHAPGGSAGGMNPQQMIRQAQVIQTHDLRKGEAIMLVATAGDSDVSAITLLAGVEPLLESSASAQNALMSGWSMGSGSDEATASAQ
jgi:hypothetical protein